MKKQIFTILLTVAFSISTFPFTASAEDSTIYIEAEDAVLQGALSVTEDTDASNHAAVGVFQNTDDSIVFTVEIPESGSYNLIFNSKGIGGEKQNRVLLDGTYFSDFSSIEDTYSEDIIQNVYIEEGTHQISIEKSWGWIWLDYLKIQKDNGISDSVYHVSDQMVNENADANTQQLFSYLCSIYGKQILSGQVCNDGLQGDEFQAIYKETGKYPAILGLDMMDYCQARIENGAESHAVETAIDFHNQGGIVEFHWHWNAPNCYLKDGTTSDGNPRWWGGFYTDNTTLDITKILDGSDVTAKELIDTDIENIAQQLQRLEQAGVSVLWRPLHEASGGWFWWGAQGPEAYKEFWIYLYNQLTETYHCNNLIWIWTGDDAEWYPGDSYVDIIGEDIYADPHTYDAHESQFAQITNFSQKMIALTENGTIFDVDNAVKTNAKWLWFDTWVGDYIEKDGVFSDEYTEAEILKKVYKSDFVVTLDELPTWNITQGDVNADGTFNIADAVLLQKWLLAVPDAKLSNWKNGDLNLDNSINIYDLCSMKQELL